MYQDFLQKIPLFAGLPREDLARLCEMIQEVRLRPGELLFAEGSHADSAYILHSGELEIVKHVDGRELFIDSHNVPGIIIGEMALLEEATRLATVRARRDSLLLGLDHNQVHELINKSPTAAKILIRLLSRRFQSLEAHVRHNEQMAQLGTLTAGIAHELNNPVAAVTRSAGQLQGHLADSELARLALERLKRTAAQEEIVARLVQQIQQAAAIPLALDPLTRSDREAELEDWLDERAIADGWQFTPTLVNLGLSTAALAGLALTFPAEQLPALLRWMAASYTAHNLLTEITQGAGRITAIVKALKSYAYLDQAPVQNVDVHAGLDDTLLILQSKLGQAISVQREYAPNLPQITTYASELNQVWTNILENAADALNGQGQITIRTRLEEGEVVVAIEDNGPGILPANLPRIFDPFFTTRPPGKGTGLGLTISHDIINKHQGQIDVTSEPGRTLFQVRLPINLQM